MAQRRRRQRRRSDGVKERPGRTQPVAWLFQNTFKNTDVPKSVCPSTGKVLHPGISSIHIRMKHTEGYRGKTESAQESSHVDCHHANFFQSQPTSSIKRKHYADIYEFPTRAHFQVLYWGESSSSKSCCLSLHVRNFGRAPKYGFDDITSNISHSDDVSE